MNESTKSMSPEAQRIAIAEATGHRWYWERWSSDGRDNWQLHLAYPPQEGIANPCWAGMAGETRAATSDEIAKAKWTRVFVNRVPNYLNDLNAMHEAEAHLDTISHPASSCRQPNVMFKLHLMQVVNPGLKLWDNGIFLGDHFHALEACRATAAQRAEALLRTLNLWEES